VERQLELKQEDNRENRRIIAGLVQRVSELESAPERREARETASEGNGREGMYPSIRNGVLVGGGASSASNSRRSIARAARLSVFKGRINGYREHERMSVRVRDID
jgi:hypothetical protein